MFVSQELPTTSVVPTSTLNVGEHSQFDHFSFLIPIHFHPPPPTTPPTSSAKTTGYHFINDPIPLFPHAHTYISFTLRYDTASVGVIFISILVSFLELDTLAFTISKHLNIRVY